MNYQETLDYIYSFIDYEKTPARAYNRENYDLRRMAEILKRVGNPHLTAKSVHIAGTKGKGSVSAMIASALFASGYTTGLYTSPHLIELRERIQVNKELISETELIKLTERLKPEAAVVNREARYGTLTTFELLTALGFMYYHERKADFQVLEVGLGGELDATNIITPEVSIITSLSYDHTAVLGNTLTEIAKAKAGIIKPGVPVVTSPQKDEAMKVLKETCQRLGSTLIIVGKDVTSESLGWGEGRQLIRVKGRLGSYDLAVPLLGYYQVDNTAVAIASLEILAEKGYYITKESIIKGMAEVSWPGRFQILAYKPTILVDGAHNGDSARRLRESILKYFSESGEKYRKAILIIGSSSDKDISAIVNELYPIFDRVIVSHSHHPRAMLPEVIVSEFMKHGIKPEVTVNVPEALAIAHSLAGGNDLICATGSLFIVGEIIELVKGVKEAR